MDLKKKQNHQFSKEKPNYCIIELAGIWGVEIAQDMSDKGAVPGTSERLKIIEECLNKIKDAIQTGDLETSTKKSEFEISAYSIVETSKYIKWAKNNGAGPRFLLEDIEPLKTKGDSSNNESEWNSRNEREFLLRTIGGLSLLLIEKTKGEKFGNRSSPNKAAIYGAIGDILSGMDFSTKGQNRNNLNKVLLEALDITMKK